MEETTHGSYGALLFDKRWKSFRTRILERDSYQCVICGATENLNLHHKQYHVTPDGKKYVPWAYDEKYVITVCDDCHARGHGKYHVPTFVIKENNNNNNE